MKVSEMSGEVLAKLAVSASPGTPWTDDVAMPDTTVEDAMTMAFHHGLFIVADGPLTHRFWRVGYASTHAAWSALWRYEERTGRPHTNIHDGEGSSMAPREHVEQRSADLCEAVCRCVVANVLGHEVDV